jgi:raffinose/stachyose/melibiose transport system substrate-binding protein
VAAPYNGSGLTQIPFLANYYYVQQENPDFASQYTANEIKLSESSTFVRGMQKMHDLATNEYLNEDYLATAFDVAARMLAEGQAAMMIIRSDVLANIAANTPELINDIGFFPLPDVDPNVRGAANWLPPALVITNNVQNEPLAKELFSFLLTDEAVAAYSSAMTPSGVFMVKGVTLPETAYPALIEAQSWLDKACTPVMEYLCPIKGPNQASVCMQVASAMITPEEAVLEIEKDNELAAVQLGLPNW